jgi:hypothetical protein
LDLAFLFDAHWREVPTETVQGWLRERLVSLSDDVLRQAFYACFIADFSLAVASANRFRLAWDEYGDPDPRARCLYPHDILAREYSGEEIVELICTGYECDAHLAHVANFVGVENTLVFSTRGVTRGGKFIAVTHGNI